MCAAASGVVVVNGSIERLSIIELLTHVLAIVERFGFFFFSVGPRVASCVRVCGRRRAPPPSIDQSTVDGKDPALRRHVAVADDFVFS